MNCIDGFQGYQTPQGEFTTCHLIIKVPTWLERYSVTLIICSIVFAVLVLCIWFIVKKYLERKYKLLKLERRRSKKSSEEAKRKKKNNQAAGGAYRH